MVLCRSMGLISFEHEITGRSIASKILKLRLNETSHLALQGNFASNSYTTDKQIDKNMRNCERVKFNNNLK